MEGFGECSSWKNWGFQCKRVKTQLGYKGRIPRMLKVRIFPVAHTAGSPERLAQMLASPCRVSKGR